MYIGQNVKVMWNGTWASARVMADRETDCSVKPDHVKIRLIYGIGLSVDGQTHQVPICDVREI